MCNHKEGATNFVIDRLTVGRSPAPGQSGVQKSRELAVLVGTAGQPRDCPNSEWVDQA